VALDRQSIEKKDFPLGRRGYDPEAVDAHLSALADEFAELTRSGRGQSASLAASAGEQVRAIVDAAESTAAEIRGDAQREAERIVAEARRELKTARERGAVEASEHVTKVAEAAGAILERIDGVERELGTLTESLRGGATRVGGDLRALESQLRELAASVSARSDDEAVVVSALEVDAVAEAAPEIAAVDAAAAADVEVKTARTAAADATSVVDAEPETVEEAAPAAAEEDLEGARLIALNMALNGSSREEIDRYLEENFDLADRKALLDEVYASVEG
jgi:DivIVA domain-containing protein